jgi:hypothetical protein
MHRSCKNYYCYFSELFDETLKQIRENVKRLLLNRRYGNYALNYWNQFFDSLPKSHDDPEYAGPMGDKCALIRLARFG